MPLLPLIFAIGLVFILHVYSLPGIEDQLKDLLKGLPVKLPLKGHATWYGQESMGSCGWWSKNDEHVVALSKDLPHNKHCGKHIVVKYKGKTIHPKVSDTCEGCDIHHIDLSRGAFAALSDGDYGLGNLPVEWHFE